MWLTLNCSVGGLNKRLETRSLYPKRKMSENPYEQSDLLPYMMYMLFLKKMFARDSESVYAHSREN